MKKLQIMIVEDNHIIAEAARMVLTSIGHEVVAVIASGEEAVVESERIRPDLVGMDIMLRDNMTGIEAIREIKDKSNIPHIFTTAYSDSAMVSEAQMTNPCGFLNKPYSERDLQELLTECFGKSV